MSFEAWTSDELPADNTATYKWYKFRVYGASQTLMCAANRSDWQAPYAETKERSPAIVYHLCEGSGKLLSILLV